MVAATAVQVSAAGVRVAGDLVVPDAARGVVVFAHGSEAAGTARATVRLLWACREQDSARC